MDKISFGINADVRVPGVLPSIAAALSASGDSTAMRAEYALLISAFDFVSELRDIARRRFPQGACQVRSVSVGGYDVIVRSAAADEAVFYAYVRFDEDKDVFVPRRLHFSVQYWGEHEAVATLAREMGEQFGHSQLATVEWWYETRDGADYRTIPRQPPPADRHSYLPSRR